MIFKIEEQKQPSSKPDGFEFFYIPLWKNSNKKFGGEWKYFYKSVTFNTLSIIGFTTKQKAEEFLNSLNK